MSNQAYPWRAGWLLGIGLALSVSAGAMAAGSTTPEAPDLTAVRAKVKAKDFKSAIADLDQLVAAGVDHADVYNVLGFAHRKSGDRKTGAAYYIKALALDPLHKGALEYQGEMFVEMGEVAKAKANLAKLIQLCPSGCEEREDLETAIAKAGKAKAK